MNGNIPIEQESFLRSDHPEAHLDFPTPEEKLLQWRQFSWPADPQMCPKCRGYGGHNLTVNAYPLPDGMEDTSENRHRYRHFRSSCDQCVGWGYVTDQRDVDCAHEFDNGRATGLNCVTEYRCKKCGRGVTVDSSD